MKSLNFMVQNEIPKSMNQDTATQSVSHSPILVEEPVLISNERDEIELVSQDNQRTWIKRTWKGIHWTVSGLFGIVSLVIVLAILAAIPIVNLLALGYLLQAEGEVARSGKLTQAFPMLNQARLIGGCLLGIFLCLLPLRYLGDFTSDAMLVDPNSGLTRFLQILTSLAAVGVFLHLLGALAAGGRLIRFFRPIKNVRTLISEFRSRTLFSDRSLAVSVFVRSFQLRKTFLLGFWGALGILMWTLIPTGLYAVADAPQGPQILITLAGGVLLTLVCSWVPVLQAGYACEERLSQYTQLKRARQLFRRTPLLWTLALLLGYAMSIVLYLFKIVAPPQDALWLLTTVFIAIIYPARIYIGWVYSRSSRKMDEPWRIWRWFWSLVSFAICGFYVFLLFFTRNIGANGKLVLFEQPLLLIPSPF
ncbi:MAG TPA: hypothetical protein DIW81_20680 [Planctomycetaceae bacterium]|nr:hypothetical protein [Rubinisphaera sp.]HCS53969.1 hypothetical protein [Planctomycetaceae bacterium]